MKVIIFTLLCTSVAIATSVGNWTVIARSDEPAHNSQEFAVLQKKYPQYFPDVDPADVESASVTINHYQYTGATTCRAGDQRLLFDEPFYEYCEKGDDPTSGCYQSVPLQMPPNADPCGAGGR